MTSKVVPLPKPHRVTVKTGLADFVGRSYAIESEPPHIVLTRDDGGTIVIPWDQVSLVTDEPA